MQFFTAGDVLDRRDPAAPENPVTVGADATVGAALSVMLDRSFSQLPVLDGDRVTGAVTYRSVARYVKSVGDPDPGATSVGMALDRDPAFVDRDRDVYELFETVAADDYVLVGTPADLQGVLTRYDLLVFLRDQVDPFLKIGEIEEAFRAMFRAAFGDEAPADDGALAGTDGDGGDGEDRDDGLTGTDGDDDGEDGDGRDGDADGDGDGRSELRRRIEATFADRAEHDPGYRAPDRLERFSFDEYRLFAMGNLDGLPDRLRQDREDLGALMVDVRDIRNALFHFRAGVDEVDRDKVDVLHGYVTGVAGTDPG